MSYNEPFVSTFLAAFGLTAKSKLPVGGASARMVNGVRVWIAPLPERPAGARGKRSTHRVLCECPRCGAQMSAGRLFQHENTAACIRRVRNPESSR